MDTPAPGTALVAWRLGAVSSTTLALALGAHVLAGGALPDAGPLAALGALVLAGSAALARRRLTARTLLPAVTVAQAALHTALERLGHAAPGALVGVPAGAGHHAAADALLAGATSSRVGTPGAGAVAVVPAVPDVPGLPADVHALAGHPTSVVMLAAHMLAVLVTVGLLLGTDRGLRALARRWARLVPLLAGDAGVPAGPRRTAPVPRPGALGAVAHATGTPGWRGPPAPARARALPA